MNHFTFSAVLVFLAAFPAGIYFILKKSPAERFFGAFWLSVSFWTFLVGFQFWLLRYVSGFVWGLLLHVGCILVPIIYYHFSLIWTQDKRRFLLWAGYGLYVFFLVLNLRTDLFTGEHMFRSNYYYPKPGQLYPLYILYFQVYGVLSTWNIFQLRKKLSANKQIYWLLFLVVHLFAYAGSMDNYLIMYDRLIFPLYPYGLYFILPYVLIGSYAFHQLKHASNSAS